MGLKLKTDRQPLMTNQTRYPLRSYINLHIHLTLGNSVRAIDLTRNVSLVLVLTVCNILF